MTLQEKIGQLFIVGIEGKYFNKNLEDKIKELKIGGVFLQGGSNLTSIGQMIKFINKLQETSLKYTKIPLFISIDQETGAGSHLISLMGFTDTPGNMALGASKNPEDTYTIYKLTGDEIKLVGINMSFAPVVDMPKTLKNHIYIRGFSDNYKVVAELGKNAVLGFKDAGVIPVAKHFPGGYGMGNLDAHKLLAEVKQNKKDLTEDLYIYKELIATGLDAIMTAHILYPEIDKYPATLSKKILKDILRKELNFSGILITDSITMGGISKYYSDEDATILALKASVDVILVCPPDIDGIKRRINAILNAIKNGEIKEEEINEKKNSSTS